MSIFASILSLYRRKWIKKRETGRLVVTLKMKEREQRDKLQRDRKYKRREEGRREGGRREGGREEWVKRRERDRR